MDGTGRAWSLRARLLAVVLVLAGAGLVVFGATSVVLIRNSMESRVDAQLQDFGRQIGRLRVVSQGTQPTGRVDLPTEFRVALFRPDGTQLSLRGQAETDTGGPMLPRVDSVTAPVLAKDLFTVDDRSSSADWRVRVIPLPDGTIAAVALSLATAQETVNRLLIIELVAGAVLLLVLALGGIAIVRIGLRPLTRIEHTALQIAGGDLDSRVDDADERTEIGRLGGALNTMLGRLSSALRQREQSERRLRRFAADASHELRTPLTSIRGFAELYRSGGAPERSDVDRMMARIESESLRMGLLVDDLLLLARLDEQRPMDVSDVDLVVLAGDAVHDISVSEPDRTVVLHADDGPVVVSGDEHRLRQVLTNLVGNAVAHTDADITVSVGVEHRTPSEPDASAGAAIASGTPVAVLEVRDEGPGIAVAHAPNVFDRFFRVDASRSRRRGGSGLGLAITAAIVQAHDGVIELDTAPGHGCVFRVLLPLP